MLLCSDNLPLATIGSYWYFVIGSLALAVATARRASSCTAWTRRTVSLRASGFGFWPRAPPGRADDDATLASLSCDPKRTRERGRQARSAPHHAGYLEGWLPGFGFWLILESWLTGSGFSFLVFWLWLLLVVCYGLCILALAFGICY